MKKWEFRDFKTCLLCSVLLALSFPPFPFGFLAPISLAIFINFIVRKEPRAAFRLGYVMGVLWVIFTLFWIAVNTPPGALVVIVISPLQYAVVWWLFNRLHKQNKNFALWAFPFLWVAGEYLRHFSDLRFNWLNIAYTQTYYLPFIQISDITGYLGVTFLLAIFSVLIYLIYFRRERAILYTSLLSGILFLVLIYGFYRIHYYENRELPTFRMGIVQPDVNPFKKWEPAFQDSAFRMLKLSTIELSRQNAGLIIWPETATPFYLRNKGQYLNEVFKLVDSLQISLITGTPDYKYFEGEGYRTYNAAFYFSPGNYRFGTYYKMALVPAAESMPFKKVFPFLRKIDVGGGDFFPGDEFKVFTVQTHVNSATAHRAAPANPDSALTEVKVSTVICFESVFPHLVRQFVKNGAKILTIITNDGWFGNTSGPYQHAQYAVFRAVENRVSVARSANTGISLFIDPSGKKHEQTRLNEKADIIYDVPVNVETTFYTKYGDWLGLFSLIVSFLFIILSLFI
ncbi:MAG: apolipoprotein N-acyltransferase [Calditrichia bacterium]